MKKYEARLCFFNSFFNSTEKETVNFEAENDEDALAKALEIGSSMMDEEGYDNFYVDSTSVIKKKYACRICFEDSVLDFTTTKVVDFEVEDDDTDIYEKAMDIARTLVDDLDFDSFAVESVFIPNYKKYTATIGFFDRYTGTDYETVSFEAVDDADARDKALDIGNSMAYRYCPDRVFINSLSLAT